MLRLTPQEFQARLLRLSNSRGTVMARATGSASLAVKREVIGVAMLRVRRTPKAKLGWVKYRVDENPEGAVSEVRLRTGFGHLAELGSYKHPDGYPMRRTKKRTRFKDVGVRAAAWHPPIKAQPFWGMGVQRARPSIDRIYYEAVNREVRKHFA